MVPIQNYLEKLDNKVNICDIFDLLKKSHAASGLTTAEVSKKMEISRDYYYDQLNTKRNVSIRFLKQFAQHVDPYIFDKIYRKRKIIFTAKRKRLSLPKVLTAKLAYFFGYLQGDGHLTSDCKSIGFTDEYHDQLAKINNLSKKLFGFTGRIYPKLSKNALKPCYTVEIKSLVLNSFFHNVFGLNRGKKINLRIPEKIGKNDELTKWYLAGLFDADGTLPKDPENSKQLFIDITMKDRPFIEQINQKLNHFGIETLKIYE
jgi:intein/homing endonuclease